MVDFEAWGRGHVPAVVIDDAVPRLACCPRCRGMVLSTPSGTESHAVPTAWRRPLRARLAWTDLHTFATEETHGRCSERSC